VTSMTVLLSGGTDNLPDLALGEAEEAPAHGLQLRGAVVALHALGGSSDGVGEPPEGKIGPFDEVLQDRLGYDLVRDVQVLTPTHKGPLGTVELNIELQRLLQKKLYCFDVPDLEPGHRPRFYAGDKVIQTKNDYELGVMNGAMGVVLGADPGGGLTVNFDGMSVEIGKDSDAPGNLQLAYATSIHKVQGSEFPCAVVVAHKSHSFMHHRNLLYTAVTRAMEAGIIVGDRWGIDNCAAKRQVDRRNTFLSFLLHQETRP